MSFDCNQTIIQTVKQSLSVLKAIYCITKSDYTVHHLVWHYGLAD